MEIRMACLFDTTDAKFDTSIFDILRLSDDETLHLADSLTKSGIRRITEGVHRIIGLFDTIDARFDMGAFDTDALYVTDSHLIGFVFSESLHIIDSIVKSGIKQLSESINAIDSMLKSGIRYLSEGMHFIDSYLIKYIFIESVHLIDSYLIKYILLEGINFIDTIATSGVRQLSEGLHTIDSILYRIFTDEVVAIIDSISSITGTKLIHETLHIVNWFRGKLRRKLSDWTKIFKEY